ncbi:MAG: alanine--tRNA ligase [Eubacterium sp.]|nr:alanine--tRNA ligase [Eubacterium sp.]
MKKLGLNEIREKFLSFYASKEHYRRGSFSLVPQNDKSLLIINSGMAPLKPFFAGLEKPPAPRMTTCQKCIRTGDIENVGITSRHGTFFEMLGSFSFGDYFKEESITWGWEFVSEVMEMPLDKIWATVYEDDDEAYNIWKNKIGFPEERIVRLGKDDNFWEIGTGPCGPCSEIYFDRGEKYGCDNPDCKPGCDCDRYIEFWNHVFTQFSKQEDGTYENLAKPNIDTGMGLERIACIMQGVDSIFDVDTIRYVLDEVCRVANVEYHDGAKPEDVSIRIITDHIRSATFMIGDTIMPSNEGRGYVLRRLIRRAIRHGKKLGIEGAFLNQLVDKVIETSGAAYPELEEQKIFIKKIIAQEEERFSKTLNQGLGIIEDYIKEMEAEGVKLLSGEKAFKLHDTYGFPFEITQEIIEEKGYEVRREDFDEFMARQKEMGKSDAAKSDEAWKESEIDYLFEEATEFTGYTSVKEEATVKAMFLDQSELESLSEGEEGRIILDKTPFYAKGGGQNNDFGVIENENFKAEVVEVTKYKDTFGHKVRVISGSVKAGDVVTATVDEVVRNNSARNHTCTHILHKALRDVLGEHVHQAGSSVDNKTLRFDFSHYEAVSKEQLEEVAKIVNEKINEFLPVVCKEMSMDEAKEAGAMGLFEDKYGDVVRVVSVGDFSRELCGGIHVTNSGQIGSFKILSESGIAAGVRRIEAVTGEGLLNQLMEKEAVLNEVAALIKAKPNAIVEKLTSLLEENKEVKSELESLKKQSLNNASEELINEAKEINGVKLITKEFKDTDVNDLRTISDELKAKYDNLALVFATVNGPKVTLLVSLTKDVVEKGYHAGNMIKEIAKAAGGGGGGKPDMAQAGAKDAAKIPDAFKVAEGLL